MMLIGFVIFKNQMKHWICLVCSNRFFSFCDFNAVCRRRLAVYLQCKCIASLSGLCYIFI